MSKYSKSLSYHEKAFTIRQKSLSPNHPDVAISQSMFGSVYEKMGEYSKALSYYERALGILERSLPSNHPDLQALRQSIDFVEKETINDF